MVEVSADDSKPVKIRTHQALSSPTRLSPDPMPPWENPWKGLPIRVHKEVVGSEHCRRNNRFPTAHHVADPPRIITSLTKMLPIRILQKLRGRRIVLGHPVYGIEEGMKVKEVRSLRSHPVNHPACILHAS